MSGPAFLRSVAAAYDTIAADYAERFHDELVDKPLERALLDAFAEHVRRERPGLVADVGCGPGQVTAYLHTLGLTAFGIDLSARMVDLARRTHPGLRFDEGSMTALDLGSASVDGLLAWYSTIHIPTERLPGVFREFRRVLTPGGYVLLGFQTGDETRRFTDWFGHKVELDLYLRAPDRLVDLLAAAGFTPVAHLIRQAEGPERTPRAYVLARKPSDD